MDRIAHEAMAPARTLGSIRRTCQDAITAMTREWNGSDAQTFANRWRSLGESTLADLEQSMQAMSRTLTRNAEAQRQASAATGGAATPTGGAPTPTPAPTQPGPTDPVKRQAEIATFEQQFGTPPSSSEDWKVAAMLDPHTYQAKNDGHQSVVQVASRPAAWRACPPYRCQRARTSAGRLVCRAGSHR